MLLRALLQPKDLDIPRETSCRRKPSLCSGPTPTADITQSRQRKSTPVNSALEVAHQATQIPNTGEEAEKAFIFMTLSRVPVTTDYIQGYHTCVFWCHWRAHRPHQSLFLRTFSAFHCSRALRSLQRSVLSQLQGKSGTPRTRNLWQNRLMVNVLNLGAGFTNNGYLPQSPGLWNSSFALSQSICKSLLRDFREPAPTATQRDLCDRCTLI